MIDPARMYTYVCNDVRAPRKGLPDRWTTVDKAAGDVMFRSYPYFEFIPGQDKPEPVRYGDFVVDIDTGGLACGDAVKILAWFETVYGIEPEQWRIFLSGKKGVHLELPDTLLGTEAGHRYLPLAYKCLAKEIEGECGARIDTSMYNRGTGKPYRQPNVMREETGTCKRQVDYNTLCEITDESGYRAACSEPGELWKPENTTVNVQLAGKIKNFIALSEQQQETIRNTPPLSEDDRDRLAIKTPPCILALATITNPGRTGNTFNDVAIQLTAYAITAGWDEARFLEVCREFIARYPSSSLTTQEKRMENCKARYRTMAANGNYHSCAAVLALRFPGFDCQECHAKTVLATTPPAINIMSREELEVESGLTLIIPPEISSPGGLISLGMEALSAPGMPNIQQYNLPVILTHIANAIAGKFTLAGVWPNLYNIKIGPTSSGKTTADTVMVTAMNEAGIKGFYGPTDFASGAALLRGLVDYPKVLVIVDEATSLFRRYDRGDPVSDGKRDVLLELFSRSGQVINKAYSDRGKTIMIEYPCVSLLGNATPVVFDAIRAEDFDTGLMQRFDFWCYDGPAPDREVCADDNPKLARFVEGVEALRSMKTGSGDNLRDLLMVPIKMDMMPKAREALNDWSRDVIQRVNSLSQDGERGIISRQYNLAIKYAMVHQATTRPVEAVMLPTEERDIQYGIAVASMLCEWKLGALQDRVTEGPFHRQCEIFKQAIISAMRLGRRPTFKVLAHRRRELKNWKMIDSAEVIKVLSKRGEIVLDESKRNTAYYLAKKDE